MTAVLDQVKTAAYTSVGVNLLVTDAIVRREVRTPEFMEQHTALARKHATDALTELRARTEPRITKIAEQMPEQVGDVVTSSRSAAWSFIGIDAPKVAKAAKATASKTTKTSTAKV